MIWPVWLLYLILRSDFIPFFKGFRISPMMKRNILFLTVIILSFNGYGQCAMCKAVVEQGGEEVAEGINSGIVYLMAFPYVVVAIAAYLFYKNWKKTSV